MDNKPMIKPYPQKRDHADPSHSKKDNKQTNFEWISIFSSEFERNIRKPIELRESLMKNNELQRCLQHNIIYSIYCTICRKTLCASCMYSSLQHRKHRVIPVENAIEEIKQDLKSFSSKVPRILQQCEGISHSNNDYLVKMERDFNPIAQRIQQFYQNLRSFIKVKQKQQMNLLKQKKDSIRAQINAYNGQLTKITQYVTQKYKSYANANIKSELVLPARNILQTVLQATVFVKQPQIDTEVSRFNVDGDKIKVALEEIVLRIGSFVPEFESNLDSRNRFTSRSVDQKLKSSPPHSKKKTDKLKWQKNKRTNSSVAAQRTLRKF